MNDFMIYLQWMWWEWEKNPEIYTKNKGKIPRLVALPSPPSIKLEADCFPGRKNRKQVGPTLGGAGILIYRGKKNLGVGHGMG